MAGGGVIVFLLKYSCAEVTAFRALIGDVYAAIQKE
jgi:hypothetical protein